VWCFTAFLGLDSSFFLICACSMIGSRILCCFSICLHKCKFFPYSFAGFAMLRNTIIYTLKQKQKSLDSFIPCNDRSAFLLVLGQLLWTWRAVLLAPKDVRTDMVTLLHGKTSCFPQLIWWTRPLFPPRAFPFFSPDIRCWFVSSALLPQELPTWTWWRCFA
jgi:hypothetical protein